MSPERAFSSLSNAIRGQLREQIHDYDRVVQSCPFVFMVQKDIVTKVLIGDSISEGILKDAKKEKSPWNLVRPLYDQEKWVKGNMVHRNSEKLVGGGGKMHGPYTGNHRSVVKGAGGEAFWRRIAKKEKIR